MPATRPGAASGANSVWVSRLKVPLRKGASPEMPHKLTGSFQLDFEATPHKVHVVPSWAEGPHTNDAIPGSLYMSG